MRIASESSETGVLMPNFVGLTKRAAKEQAIELGLQWDPTGIGRVIRQEPIAGTPFNLPEEMLY